MEKVKCDCGCIIHKNNIQRHNRTKKHIELMKVDKDKREEKININNRTLKVMCDCGSVVLQRQFKRHTATPKHKKLIEQKQGAS